MERSVVLSCTASLLLYMNTLTADFAYDDSRAIQKNQDLQPETPILNIFFNDFWGTPLTHSGSHKSYRPLCVLTFRLNYLLGALNPMGYHLGNVILHVIVTGLFTHLVKQVTKRTYPTMCAGLLFAVHPIHTEAVAGVVGRADVGAAMFFILAILSYINYCKTRDASSMNEDGATQSSNVYLCLVAIFTGASMLTKEQGVTVLAVCAVYDVFVHHKLKPQDYLHVLSQKKYLGLVKGLVSLVMIGVGLLSFRMYLMGNRPPDFAPADNPASDSASIVTRTLTFLYLPCLNLGLLLFPWVLSFDWSMASVPLLEAVSDPRNICTVLFYTGLFYVIVYCLQSLDKQNKQEQKQRQRQYSNSNGVDHHSISSHGHKSGGNGHAVTSWRRSRYVRRSSTSSTDSNDDNQNIKSKNRNLDVIFMSLALAIFPFIPASNLFFYVGFVVAERVLYIPSMGYCLLVSYGAFKLDQKYKHNPSRRKMVNICVMVLMICYGARTVLRNRDWHNEESLYQSGIRVNPAKAWGNLANIYNSQGRVQKAEEAYRNALSYRGNMADVHYNLGILLQEQKRYPEAIRSYENAINFRPRLTLAYLNLGIVLGLLRRHEEAKKMYKACAEIDITGLKDPRLHESTRISALYNLGRLEAEQGLYHEAIASYHLAIQRRPSHYAPQSLYNMLGEAYLKLNKLEDAEYWYREALKVKPNHIPAHLTMARLYHKKNQIQEADSWFQKALTIDGTDSSIFQHYGQFLSETNRQQEASEFYIRAAEAVPGDFELIFNVANTLRQANRNIEAENFYKKAVRLRPDAATAHMNLGAMLHFNGKLLEAEGSYLRALKLKPEDSMTRQNLQKLRNLMHNKGMNSSKTGR